MMPAAMMVTVKLPVTTHVTYGYPSISCLCSVFVFALSPEQCTKATVHIISKLIQSSAYTTDGVGSSRDHFATKKKL